MASPVEDKLALYADGSVPVRMCTRFGGRTTARATRAGCQPWPAGGAREWTAARQPLATDGSGVGSYLAGHTFVGLYPLLRDNTCHFLVADFGGPAAMLDALVELTRPYGHVVIDECHHLAAAAHDYSVKRIGAQFWPGLTATPTRRDGLGEPVTWQLGPVRNTLAQAEPGTLLQFSIDVPGPRRVLRVHDTEFRYSDLDLNAPGAIAEVHRALVADVARNSQIVRDISAALARGRNCLVLTRRVAHNDLLASALAEAGHASLVLQGGMTTADRRAAVDRLADTKPGDGILVIGTTPFIGEGFDAPARDTLFLAAPISFDGLLIQCAGRVVRAMPGKDTAEVHDYHDPAVPILAASLQRRMPGHRALGFART